MIEYIVFILVMIFLFPGPLLWVALVEPAIAWWKKPVMDRPVHIDDVVALQRARAASGMPALGMPEAVQAIQAARAERAEEDLLVTHDAVWQGLSPDVRYAMASPAQQRRHDERNKAIRIYQNGRWVEHDLKNGDLVRRSRDDDWEVAR